ncbi:hypothetical protein Q1695_002484 [Nippostrongylus brasiliensis]|nr:hypothetical protein Q1695_002484 [Nippostrongylus brasiliensis]
MCDDDDEEQQDEIVEIEPGTCLRDVWAVVRQIGRGAYGQVYHVLNIKTGVQAALKAESKSQQDRVLKMERDVLQSFKGVKGAMQLLSMGTTDTYSYIIMTLCGADLSSIIKTMKTLTDGTVLLVALRTLLALKQLHEIGFVHRDIKPCNFAISHSSNRIIHVIDFGMTRRYAVKDKGEWKIKRRRAKIAFRGTLRYCSTGVHYRNEQGRVDDLWSWVYMCIELKDPLPWSQLAHPEAILGSKEDTSIEKICASEITKTFIPIAKLFQNLGYFDRPEYQKISEMLLQEIARLKVKLADPYEWEGKMSDPEATAKLTEVCNKYNLKFEDLPHTICDDATEESESKYIRDVFAPHPSDVPGGEQYEEKKRKSSERRNTDANASTPVTNA